MSPIEDYIHHATLGLPKDERPEIAAHLRETLHGAVERVQSLGLERELAERWVLHKMGPPSRVNRRLLGHPFTHHLGWQVLSVLVVVVAAWLAADLWGKPQRGQQYHETTTSVAPAIIHPASFVIGLPHDIGRVLVGYSYPSGSRTLRMVAPQPDRKARTSVEPERPLLEIGTGELPLGDSDCPVRSWPAVSMQMVWVKLGGYQEGNFICTPVPEGYVPGSWESLGSSMTMDAWVPVAVFKPLIEELRRDAGDADEAYSVVRIAPVESWLVVSVWAGSEANEPAAGSQPPGIGWVRERMPGVLVELDEHERRR